MKTRPKTHTMLEKRRLKAAKATMLLAFVFLVVLSVWQCAESFQAQTGTLGTVEALDLGGADSEADRHVEQGEQDNEQSEQEDEQDNEQVDPSSDPNSTQNASKPADPLSLEQEGIEFKQLGGEGSIVWYQSSWDIAQSRVLLERALALKGWQSLSNEQEQPMSFVYAPSSTAAGGSLIAMFYTTEQGCSILLELI